MRFRLRVLLLLFACLWAAAPARAADVVMGGEVVFRLGDDARAAAVSERLEALLQSGAAPASIRVGKQGGQIGVFWGSTLVAAVSAEMARANHSTPEALAGVWASNLRSVAQRGLLRVEPARVEIPVGGEQVLRVSGLARGTLEASEPSGALEVEVNQETGEVFLRGRAVGRTKVEISRGKARDVAWVHVKDRAGHLPQQVDVRVSGRPVPGPMVAQAVLAAAAQESRVRPGCQLLLEDSLDLPSVAPGDTMRLSVPIQILGSDDYFPVQGQVPVVIRNLDLPLVESNLLLVSNRPERVEDDGILLEYAFSGKEPTRLMYSHQNGSPSLRNLWVNLANPGDEAVDVLVSLSYAGPERNEVHVGQTAARRFMDVLGRDAGFVLTIPPHSALELAAHTMQPKALVSGFATFRILEGGRATVQVRTALVPARNDGSPLPHLGAPFNPFKIHPHGVFAQPYFEEDLEYTVGGEPLMFPYGQSPWLIDFETGLPNNGNFGVLYKALVELRNPDVRPRQVGLFFVPVAGPAGGTFLVDGQVHQAAFRKKGSECLVTVLDLAPGETRTVEVVTFPEASSNYPARLEFRDGQGLAPTAGPPRGVGG